MPAPLLGVNIDHIATVRQARKEGIPSLLDAAIAATHAGADGITIHLREDRRHIQDDDFVSLAPKFRLNLEMAATDEMISIACGAKKVKPHSVCLVPERREELTTEGGLDVIGSKEKLADAAARLKAAGVAVSMFIEADPWQIEAAAEAGAEYVEIHTGRYAHAWKKDGAELAFETNRIKLGVKTGVQLGLKVNAGHGLNLDNVGFIARLDGVHELNIGYSIVCRALFVGLAEAVKEMKRAIA